MSFSITWPPDTTFVINKIRGAIGRNIDIYVTVTGIACTTCLLDPVTNLSTDPFCPECGGAYWKDTTSGWTCSAHVRWRRTDQPLWTPGGIIEEGDCAVTIANSGVALYNVQHSKYFVVDSIDLYMKSYFLKGVKTPNRIKVVLLEDKG